MIYDSTPYDPPASSGSTVVTITTPKLVATNRATAVKGQPLKLGTMV